MIADFGVANIVPDNPNDLLYTFCGSPGYAGKVLKIWIGKANEF